MILMVDGIIDNLDLCPNQPETFNAYEDADGCPDSSVSILDSDQDGIFQIQWMHVHLNLKHTIYQDDDGCPDSLLLLSFILYFPRC